MKRFVWLVCACSILGLVLLLSLLTMPSESRAQAGDRVWMIYTYDKAVSALAPQGSILWAGTWGGLLRWDLTEPTYTSIHLPMH